MSVRLGVIVPALLVTIGCSGSTGHPVAASSSAGATTAARSPAARSTFITKADAICSTALAKAKSLPKPASAASGARLDYLRPLAAILDEELNGLKSLPVPTGDEKKISLLIGWLSGEKSAADAEIATVGQPDAPPDFVAKAIGALEDGMATNAKLLTQDAQAYGFTC